MSVRRSPLLVAALGALVGVLVLALTGTTVVLLSQRGDLADARARLDALERARASASPAPAPSPSAPEDALGGLLEGLLGGEGAEGLEGLGELLGGGLGDLGAAGGVDPACLTGGAQGAGGAGLAGDGAAGLGELSDLLEGLSGGGPGGPTTQGPPASEQVERISREVERIRGLRFAEPVDTTFLPPEQVASRAAALNLEEYTPEMADDEERLLGALGAVPVGTDLRATITDLIESQVAGFYVPESDEMVVPGSPDHPLAANDRITLAHELEHALADQRLGLEELVDTAPEDPDAAIGRLSLVEGDATLTMQRYALSAVSVFEQLGMLADPGLAAGQQALDAAPAYLSQQLFFPYTAGLGFVCQLYLDGGWAAVDAAYDRPPTTSAQVLFPERYLDGETAVAVRVPAAPGAGWTQEWAGTFGAAQLLWLLEAPGGDTGRAVPDARERVAGWAGGRTVVYASGERTATGLAFVQRSGSDLCGTVEQWYTAAFGAGRDAGAGSGERFALDGAEQDAVLACSGDDVRLGIAPDLATARALTR